VLPDWITCLKKLRKSQTDVLLMALVDAGDEIRPQYDAAITNMASCS
jgi:hypothetical protein